MLEPAPASLHPFSSRHYPNHLAASARLADEGEGEERPQNTCSDFLAFLCRPFPVLIAILSLTAIAILLFVSLASSKTTTPAAHFSLADLDALHERERKSASDEALRETRLPVLLVQGECRNAPSQLLSACFIPLRKNGIHML